MNDKIFALKDNISTLDALKGVHNVELLMDLAFGVHPDFKSHMGATMGFEDKRGSAMTVSAKQKLNTERLTVGEPAGVDCAPPLVLRDHYSQENRDTK